MDPDDHGQKDASESPSTGFLPMALAAGLFVVGLFALGFVRCEPRAETLAEPRGDVRELQHS